MKTNSEYQWYLPLFIHGSSFELDISYLFRGDGRPPQDIFASGFMPRGQNTDLHAHFRPPEGLWSSLDSAYVSTSRSASVASTFPKNYKADGFLYVINPLAQGIDLEKSLLGSGTKFHDSGLLRLEQEISIPGGIAEKDIKGAWRIKSGVVTQEFVPNPNYQELTLNRVAKGLKMAGHATTGVAAIMDGIELYRAYEHGKSSGGFDRFFKEASRVIYAWTSAFGLGRVAAQAASMACAPLGPLASMTCGVAAGVAGSFFGYRAGEKIAKRGIVSSAEAASSIDPGLPVDDLGVKPPENLEQGLDDYIRSIRETFAEDTEVQDLSTEYFKAEEKPKAFIIYQQAMEEHLEHERFLRFAQSSSQFCYELGQFTHSKSAMNLAVTIKSVHDACSGIKALQTSAAGIKSLTELSLSNVSGLLNGGSLVLSAFNLFSSLIDDAPEPDNSLAIALSSIQSSIYQMWEDTRKRFELTWQLLEKLQISVNEMEKRQAKRFLKTLKAIDYYGQENLSRLASMESSVHGHLAHSEYSLSSYLHALADERTLDAMTSIHKSKTHALASFIDYSSTLKRWLTVTAAIPGRSGWLQAKVLDSKFLYQRLEEAFSDIKEHLPPLGLFAKLALKHDAAILHPKQLEKLIHPKDWVQVLSSYLYLMRLAMDEIKAGKYGPSDVYFAEIETIRESAEIVLAFYENIQTSTLLWLGLVQDYQASVEAIQRPVKQIMEDERQSMNADFELPMERYLNLDETAESACQRIKFSSVFGSQALRTSLDKQFSLKKFLMETPIPGEQRLDYTIDYSPWEWDTANLHRAFMAGAPDAYLNEYQVDVLLSQEACRMSLESLISSPEFQLAYLYQQAKLDIQCEAFIPSLHLGQYTIAFRLKLNDEIYPIYQWTGAAMPGSRGQYIGYGNLLPKMEAWAVALFWDNYKGPEYGPTQPWHELHFLSEEVNPEFNFEIIKAKMRKSLNQNILAPRRKNVVKQLLSKIKIDDFQVARLQLFAFLELLNPDFHPDLAFGAEKKLKDYFSSHSSYSLRDLNAPGRLCRELLAIDLNQHSYAIYFGDVTPLHEKFVFPLLKTIPLSQLPLVKAMQRAELELTALANELSPPRIEAHREFSALQSLKTLKSCKTRLEKIYRQSDVLLTQAAYQDNLRRLAAVSKIAYREEDIPSLSLAQWDRLRLKSGYYSDRSLFPLLLDWKFKPEQRKLILQALFARSLDDDFLDLLQEQDIETGLFPLHLAASLDEPELIKFCLQGDILPSCELGSSKTQGLIASHAIWQTHSEKLGFSLTKTLNLLQRAYTKMASMDLTTAPALIFLGPTGSGKSSLINAILGVHYELVEDKYGELVLSTDQEELAPTSHSSISATLFPSAYLSTDGQETYIDMPGEGDTRGKPEQICGGLVSQIIYRHCSSIKSIVMVLSKEAFTGRMEAVQSLIVKVSSVFSGMSEEAMIKHLKLVVTKTDGMNKRQIMLKLQKLYDEHKSELGMSSILANLIRQPEQVILVDVDKPEMLAKLKADFCDAPKMPGREFAFACDNDALLIFNQLLDLLQREQEMLSDSLRSEKEGFAHMLYQHLFKLEQELNLMVKNKDTEEMQDLISHLKRQIQPYIRPGIEIQALNLDSFYQKTKHLLLTLEIHDELLGNIIKLNRMVGIDSDSPLTFSHAL